MCGRTYLGEGDGVVGNARGWVEHAETEARGEETLDRDIELGLGEQAPLHRVREGFGGSTAAVLVPARIPAAEPVA